MSNRREDEREDRARRPWVNRDRCSDVGHGVVRGVFDGGGDRRVSPLSDTSGGFDTHFQVSLLILGEFLNELIRIVGLAIAGAGDLGYACEFVSTLVGNGESDGGNRKCESLVNNTLGHLAGRLSAVGLTVGDQQ